MDNLYFPDGILLLDYMGKIRFNKIKNMLNEDKKELCSSLTTIGDVSGQLLATILTIVLDTYKR